MMFYVRAALHFVKVIARKYAKNHTFVGAFFYSSLEAKTMARLSHEELFLYGSILC